MKKIPVIALNLRSMRIPMIISSFALTVSTIILLCNSLPPISLSPNVASTLIRTNPLLSEESPDSIGVFSMLKQSPGTAIVTAEKSPSESTVQKDAEDTVSKTPKVINPSAKVEIANSTNHSINPENYMNQKPTFLNQNFSVLIVHTHTTESYTPSDKYNYTPTDTDRTTDKSFNMVRVGNEIEKVLTENGIKVYHDTTTNDYPSYNGSYNRSGANISNFRKNDPSIQIVLDVHRDAIEGKNGEKIKYTTEINGETAAKIMLVVGSNLSGLQHDNWDENMRFAVQLQKHTESIYPSLCRPLNFRSQRFNQQLTPGSIIVEVGTNGNTLDEALLGAHYFAEGLADFIQAQK